MFVSIWNAYDLRYNHPEGGWEYIDDIIYVWMIAGVVENSGMRITLKIQGKLRPIFPKK